MAAASAELRAFVSDGPGHVVAALHAADMLPPDSPVPAQLAGLCARLGINGHGITASTAPSRTFWPATNERKCRRGKSKAASS
jgi:hypothetical protein